jgi:hypothetical protein
MNFLNHKEWKIIMVYHMTNSAIIPILNDKNT